MTWAIGIAYGAFTVYVVARLIMLIKEKAPDIRFANGLMQIYDWLLLVVAASYWYKPICRFFRDSGTSGSYFGFGWLIFGLVLNLVVLVRVYARHWRALGPHRVPMAVLELIVARVALPCFLLSLVYEVFVVGHCP